MASATRPRPSISGSSIVNGSLARPALSSRASSLANAVSTSAREEDYVNPDDLFAKHTVAEIRVVQRRLKTDADGKQEELRLMVGERYRDLLQASASIISIAQSASTMLDAIEDMKVTVRDRTKLRIHKRTTSTKQDDTRLRSLQSLAAHIKLLLDAPEHLWRLLERKRYLQAAWLFLLARVVHRSLASEEMDEDEGWHGLGIDTLDHFPLAQKQWDTISHFRPQITHKAMLYLRETNMSTEEACATLLTLHLTDSRPLTETLSVFIAQRSKALDILFSRKPEEASAVKIAGAGDVAVPGRSAKHRPRTRKAVARETWHAVEAVLNAISGTVGAARDIFLDDSPERQSLIRRVLEYITKDETSAFADSLPPDLRLSTQRFLTTLPSSSQLLLLPAGLRQYKPYVDLTSTSTIVAQPDLSNKLENWFYACAQRLKTALKSWLVEIETVRQVWAIRRWARDGIQNSTKLEDKEKIHIASALDDVCRTRVVEIWTSVLQGMEQLFLNSLRTVIASLLQPSDFDPSDLSPVQHLLRVSSQTMPAFGSADTSPVTTLDSFANQLESQLNGRTPLLDQVLSPLESRAYRLQRDLNFMSTDEEEARTISTDVLDQYHSDADAFCQRISSTLALETEQALNTSTEALLPVIVFIGRVAYELASHSEFTSTIGMRQSSVEAFRASTYHLHSRAVSTWQQRTLSSVMNVYRKSLRSASTSLSIYPEQDLADVTRPSSSLMHALLSLSTAVQELGMHRDADPRRNIVESTLQLLVDRVVENKADGTLRSEGRQILSDLFFLRSLVEQWQPALEHAREALDNAVSTLVKEVKKNVGVVFPSQAKSEEHLARCQLVLDALLPPRTIASTTNDTASTALLRLGAGATEEHFISVMNIVKPSARFGLLMVTDTGT